MSNLPKSYAWLEKEVGPSMLVSAIKYYGVAEVVGKGDNPMIMKWAKDTKQVAYFPNDETPWCGLFMAQLAYENGLPFPAIAVRASEWAKFGMPVKVPMLGDVLVFTRQGGGHVGLYVGEDEVAYHVLGGNQSNMVCITRIAKTRLTIACRQPWREGQRSNSRRILLSASGTLSKNEA